MSTYLQDLEEVRAVIQLYIDGANGDVAKLKQAFHPDARMFGHIGPMDTYVPIGDFIAHGGGPARHGRAELQGRSSAPSTSPVTPASPCWWRPTTSAATSSTTSPWRASTAAGRSPTRPTPTPAASRRRTERKRRLALTAAPNCPRHTTERTTTSLEACQSIKVAKCRWPCEGIAHFL